MVSRVVGVERGVFDGSLLAERQRKPLERVLRRRDRRRVCPILTPSALLKIATLGPWRSAIVAPFTTRLTTTFG